MAARCKLVVTRVMCSSGRGACCAALRHDGNGQSRQVHPPKTPRPRPKIRRVRGKHERNTHDPSFAVERAFRLCAGGSGRMGAPVMTALLLSSRPRMRCCSRKLAAAACCRVMERKLSLLVSRLTFQSHTRPHPPAVQHNAHRPRRCPTTRCEPISRAAPAPAAPAAACAATPRAAALPGWPPPPRETPLERPTATPHPLPAATPPPLPVLPRRRLATLRWSPLSPPAAAAARAARPPSRRRRRPCSSPRLLLLLPPPPWTTPWRQQAPSPEPDAQARRPHPVPRLRCCCCCQTNPRQPTTRLPHDHHAHHLLLLLLMLGMRSLQAPAGG
jgi:hypothetical protein